MDKINELLKYVKAGSIPPDHVIKDAESEIADLERTMEAQARRFHSQSQELSDAYKNERDLAHRIAKVNAILKDAKL